MNWNDEIQAEFSRLQKTVDVGVVEEMAQHASCAFEAARADGMTAAEAEASVRALIMSWCSGTSGPRGPERPPLIEAASTGTSRLAGLRLDVRFALRMLRWQPGFAFVSIAMIALAIASTTSIFSVVNGVLLKPLPWAKGSGLVRVFETGKILPSATPVVTNLTYRAWADSEAQTISGIGGWSYVSMAFDGPSGVELMWLGRVTASLFPLLGVTPVLGSHFTEANEIADDAVIISYGFWQERFAGAPNVLGQKLTLGGRTRTIVGVMPRGFEFPNKDARMWLTERVDAATIPSPDGRGVGMSIRVHNALARLKPGATPQQATSEVAARAAGVIASVPDIGFQMVFGPDGVPRIAVVPMLDWMVQDVKPALWILLAAVILLFAAAVGNVANMQLARANARQREIAIRAAIGAGSRRLTRQLFVETTTIAVIGGALGLGLTFVLLRVLPTLLPEDFPRLQEIAIDGRALVVVTGLTMIVSIITGVLPARMAHRVKLTSALAEDGSAPVGQSLRSPVARSRALIMTGQVSIAALLLVGAALLSQSFVKLVNVDRGYQPANLLTARITHMIRGLPAGARPIFYKEVLDRLSATPGVTHVALTDALPLTPRDMPVQIRDAAMPRTTKDRPIKAVLRLVSNDYFAAMGMRVKRGRGFTNQDVVGSEPVMVVNETFANRYYRGNAVDVILDFENDVLRDVARYFRVVGVVADVTQRGVGEPVEPEIFATIDQRKAGPLPTQYLTARTTGDPAALAVTLREIISPAGRNGVLEQVMTMETRLMNSLSRPRLYAVLLGGFATFALLVAGIGLLGGLYYSVTQRTREIGVRTALGATPRDIIGLVMKQGIVMTLVGLVLGLTVAALTVRYLEQFLFGIEPFDPLTFAIAGVSLLIVALAACAIPAGRAARIDPMTALGR